MLSQLTQQRPAISQQLDARLRLSVLQNKWTRGKGEPDSPKGNKSDKGKNMERSPKRAKPWGNVDS